MDTAFPSVFYGAAVPSSSAASHPLSKQSLSLLQHHSRSILSRNSAFMLTMSGAAFVRMLYELWCEANRARDILLPTAAAAAFSAAAAASPFQALFDCLRACVSLHTAIAGVHRSGALEQAMQLALLLHNDCAFAAQHLTLLHALVRMEDLRRTAAAATTTTLNESSSSSSNIASPASSPSTPLQLMLVDLSAPLSSLGSSFLQLHLRRLRVLVSELGDGLASSLGHLEDDASWQRALQATKRALHQLAQAEKAWQQCMGPNAMLTGTAAGATMPGTGGAASSGLSSTSSTISGGGSSGGVRSNGWPLLLGKLLEQLTSRLVAAVIEKSDISIEGGQQASINQQPQQRHLRSSRARARTLSRLCRC
jgi:hypothetical protein